MFDKKKGILEPSLNKSHVSITCYISVRIMLESTWMYQSLRLQSGFKSEFSGGSNFPTGKIKLMSCIDSWGFSHIRAVSNQICKMYHNVLL